MKNIVIVILLFASLNANPCTTNLAGSTIDLNPLKRQNDITIQADGFYDIIINFCTTITNPPTCDNKKDKTAYHVHWQNIEECNWIGGDYTNNDVEVTPVNPSNPEGGVFLTYKNGQRFWQQGQILGSETKIRINCNKEVELGPVVFQSNNVVGDKVVYYILTESKHACAKPRSDKCVIRQDVVVDLNFLKLPTDLNIQADGFYNIKLNFCKPVTTPALCSGNNNKMAHRVHWQNDDECYWIGGDYEDTELSFINPRNPNLGVVLNYKNGQQFNQGGQLLGSETRIGITCDPNVELSRVTFHGTTRENNKNVYLLRASSKHACPQVEKICTFSNSGYHVDLNPLREYVDFRIQADGFYDVVLNFCTPVTVPLVCNNQSGKMAHHVHWQNDDECNWIGGDFSTKDVEIEFMVPAEKGVKLRYKNGSRFNQNGRYLGSETLIEIECDQNVHLSLPVFHGLNTEGDKTIWLIKAKSKFACASRI